MVASGNANENLSRRSLLRRGAAAGVGTMAWPWWARAAAGASSKKPNIVMIYVDDMGYGDASCYSDEAWVKTPAIDRLANKGVRFTQGYVAGPVCYPSRVGLMTGACPPRFGCYHNKPWVPIPEEHKLMPTSLKAGGYKTAMIGKWNDVKYNDPCEIFDEAHHVLGWTGQYWPYKPGKDDRDKIIVWGPKNAGDEYQTDQLTDSACDFIGRHKADPFFVYLSYNAPHTPLRAKTEHREAVAHLPTEPERVYAAMILAIDEGVAKVMATLAEHGLADNTLVVFASDNGPTHVQHKMTGYRDDWPEVPLGSVGPLSGKKKNLLEGGVRVPFIMHWPAALKPGVVDDHVVSTLDLFPTSCAVAGIAMPEQPCDGVDLLPHLRGETAGPRSQDLFWNLSRRKGAVRSGDWKLHTKHLSSGRIAPEALYNLADDIDESDDLAKAQPEKTQELLAAYTAWYGQMSDPPEKRKKKQG